MLDLVPEPGKYEFLDACGTEDKIDARPSPRQKITYSRVAGSGVRGEFYFDRNGIGNSHPVVAGGRIP
jgi:hypothetical protein